MNSRTADAAHEELSRGGTIEITTIGRRTGRPHRIEIWLHNIDGDLYITGRPGFRRDWLANLKANPRMTLHLGRRVGVELEALAEEITDPYRREYLLRKMLVESWNSPPDRVESALGRWVASAPLVSVETADRA